MGRPHPLEGNPKVREEVEVEDQDGEESTMTAYGDGEAAMARGNGKAAVKFWHRQRREAKNFYGLGQGVRHANIYRQH
jgi:hypothetical protein